MAKLTKLQAKEKAIADGIDFSMDFHALSSEAYLYLEDLYDQSAYRAPSSNKRSGSPLRYFFYYLAK